MSDRHKQLFGRRADDADVRGEHRYAGEAPPRRLSAEHAEEALTREPGRYVAGADGTQQVSTRPPRR